MYNLIVANDPKDWKRTTYAIEASRFGEYTPEPLKIRYGRIDEQTVAELLSFPTIFAYEDHHHMPARIGRIVRGPSPFLWTQG